MHFKWNCSWIVLYTSLSTYPAQSLSHTPTHSHTHIHTHTLTHSLTHTHARTHLHNRTLTLSLSHSNTHTHVHTHTHTHTLILVLFSQEKVCDKYRQFDANFQQKGSCFVCMHSIRCEKWQKIEKNESDITLVEKKERKYITIKWSTKIMLMLWNTKIKYANCWSFCCYWKSVFTTQPQNTKIFLLDFYFRKIEIFSKVRQKKWLSGLTWVIILGQLLIGKIELVKSTILRILNIAISSHLAIVKLTMYWEKNTYQSFKTQNTLKLP